MLSKRRWKLGIIFLLLFTFVFFLSYRADSSPEASWLDRMSYRLVSPISALIKSPYQWISQKISLIKDAADILDENIALEKENNRLKQEIILLEEFKEQTLRINKQYEKLQLDPFKTRAARVISFDVRSAHQSILINLGKKDGVKENQTVLANGALAGRVIRVAPRYSQVLLINDPRSQVDVLEKSTRARGTLMGKKKAMRLSTEYFLTQADYFSTDASLKEGQMLITTGQDGLFPKGIPVGVIKKIRRDPRGLFWQAEVLPMAKLHQLEEVFLLKTQEEPVDE